MSRPLDPRAPDPLALVSADVLGRIRHRQVDLEDAVEALGGALEAGDLGAARELVRALAPLLSEHLGLVSGVLEALEPDRAPEPIDAARC
ncbi:MAG TPA: hypothetical protein RMG45_20260, partial [Polyangiaceae bacterium LLY-WYZ-15_(1-7)]|nr:hypothetical protein [Polyangiaceae bacterium LLY-WYZ-15_(1-7)]